MASPGRFHDVLTDLAAQGGLARVERAVESGHVGMEARASLLEHPRLIVCLDGVGHYRIKQAAGTVAVKLRPREALFVAAGRWVLVEPRAGYHSLGVLWSGHTTRLYFVQSARHGGRKEPFRSEVVDDQLVPLGLGEEGVRLIRRLTEGVEGPAGALVSRGAGEMLLALAGAGLARSSAAAGGKAHYTWQAARHFVLEQLHRPLSRDDVAAHLGIHPNHISRLFHDFGDGSFHAFLQASRLSRARLLLEEPRLNISQIAQLCGFASANYFIRAFRQHHGVTPTRARVNPTAAGDVSGYAH